MAVGAAVDPGDGSGVAQRDVDVAIFLVEVGDPGRVRALDGEGGRGERELEPAGRREHEGLGARVDGDLGVEDAAEHGDALLDDRLGEVEHSAGLDGICREAARVAVEHQRRPRVLMASVTLSRPTFTPPRSVCTREMSLWTRPTLVSMRPTLVSMRPI